MTDPAPPPRLLLVDDDAEVLTLLKSRFEALKRFELFTATRAREALGRLAEIRPDLIVSDIDMPGMDGGTFAGLLREREAGKRLPVLFLSSMISPTESQAEARLGEWPMLSKKTPFDVLVQAVERSLASSRETARGRV